MEHHIGNYFSNLKTPLLKITRIQQLAKDLQYTFEDMEKDDLIKQVNFKNQLDIATKKLLDTCKSLDDEILLNTELTFEIRSLQGRIKLITNYIERDAVTIKKLQADIKKLNDYKNRKRKKFAKWLKRRIKKSNKVTIEDLNLELERGNK